MTEFVDLKDADMSLVDFTRHRCPYCKRHGAMLKFTRDGIWRCVHPSVRNGRHIENDCLAGCQERKDGSLS